MGGGLGRQSVELEILRVEVKLSCDFSHSLIFECKILISDLIALFLLYSIK